LFEIWVNPFAGEEQLVSISTAKTAPPEVSKDLMRAHEVGEEAYSESKFKSECLDTNKTPFHDRITSIKLKTFSSLAKKTSVKSQGRSMIMKADKALFGRIILIAQTRKLQMADVLGHPLGIPLIIS
jgi:hypothetical protein